jgi:hypothetical protein
VRRVTVRRVAVRRVTVRRVTVRRVTVRRVTVRRVTVRNYRNFSFFFKFQNVRAGISKFCLTFELGYNIGKETFRTPGTLKLQRCEMSSFEIVARFEDKILSKCAN